MMEKDLCEQCVREDEGCTIAAGPTASCIRFRGKKTSTWVKYNKTWAEFCAAGLNKPGTQIHVQDMKDLRKQSTLLIGDINILGGVCDDCQEVQDNQTVLKYRRLLFFCGTCNNTKLVEIQVGGRAWSQKDKLYRPCPNC